MGCVKNNRPCIDKSGKLWYNSLSNRARRLLSEQLNVYRNNHLTVWKQVVISFYLRLVSNHARIWNNNAPIWEALVSTTCIVSPKSSTNTERILTVSPSFHSLRYSYRENCSEGDIHLALSAPQRHGFKGIIAYSGGNIKGLTKITAEVRQKAFFPFQIH